MGTLGDVDAELSEFAMNSRSTPGDVRFGDRSDELDDVLVGRSTAGLAGRSALTPPEQPERFAVPANDGRGLHHDENLPRLTQFDRWCERVYRIDYCPEQVEARRLAMAAGVLPPTPFTLRMTMAYLLNQNGEGGVTCPLAMTDGLITLLEDHGTKEQVERWLPLVTDPDTPTPLTGGQFVTERQGGSNVSENETLAERAADGSWRLTGLKWFCSNPGELWVTTAKPKGSQHVGLFLMPRRLRNGKLNDAFLLRLKDLSGTRGKATAEVEFRGAYAEAIGRPSQGLALLLRTVLRTVRPISKLVTSSLR